MKVQNGKIWVSKGYLRAGFHRLGVAGTNVNFISECCAGMHYRCSLGNNFTPTLIRIHITKQSMVQYRTVTTAPILIIDGVWRAHVPPYK